MTQVIWNDIVRFFCMYAWQGIQFAGITFLLIVGFEVGYIREHGKQSLSVFGAVEKAVLGALLVMYTYIVIGITMLSRSESYTEVLDFKLFHTFSSSFSSRMYIYENILLFIPLAILLFLLARPFRNCLISLGTGILCSLSIEVSQLITHLGRFQVDDILTNTIGMLIGFCICKVVEWLVK